MKKCKKSIFCQKAPAIFLKKSFKRSMNLSAVNCLVNIKDLYERITKTIWDWSFCEFWYFCYSMKMEAKACSKNSLVDQKIL
jgi:hypothetical protein